MNLKAEILGRHPTSTVDKLADDVKSWGNATEWQFKSRCEASLKLLNVTDTQDLRLRLGVNLMDGSGYMEVHENHLQLKGNSKGEWSMLYDL